MGKGAITPAILIACSLGTTLAADIEITPMVGYRWGGEIKAHNTALLSDDADIDDAATLGLALGIRPKGGFIVELSVDRQESALIEDDLLFGQGNELFDFDTTYYQVGMGYNWRHGDFEPFLLGSLGVAHLSPDVPGANSEDEFSISFGGGVKIWANRHFGFRFEGRGYWANTDEDENDCAICPGDDLDDDLFQGQARVGLIVSF